MQIKTSSEEMRVSDLSLAAYILALGYALLRCEHVNKRKVFVFKDVPDEVTYTYYRGEDTISARKLFGAYRDLKGLIAQEL